MSDIPKNNYIYYLQHEIMTFCNELNLNGCKIGSTCYLIPRMKTYQTGYADKVPLICAYKIINKICYDVDDMIQEYFNDIRLNTLGSLGGTEFYDADKLTTKHLEQFFKQKNIIYDHVDLNEEDFKIFRERTSKEEKKVIIDEDEQKEKISIKKEKKYFSFVNDVKLKDWQKEANKCKVDFINSDEKSALIIAATGSGKSYLMNFFSICEYIYNTDNDVLIITKRKEILDKEFIKTGNDFIDKFKINAEIVNLISNKKTIDYKIFSQKEIKSRLFLINSDKFVQSNNFNDYINYDFGKIKLVIFDECHWCGANKIYNFLKYMLDNNKIDKLLGLSATPIRFQEKNKNNSLSLFGNNKNEYNVIYSRSYLDAIKFNDRTETKWIMIPVTNKDLIEVEIEVEDEEDDEIYNKKIIGKSLNSQGIKTFVKWLNDFLTPKKSVCNKGILWFPNKKSLIQFDNFMKKNKEVYNNLVDIEFIPTYCKSTNIDVDTENNLEKFKENKTKSILLAVFRATEGFDDKSVDFGFNVYIANSSNPLLDQQKEGRVSRTFGDKKVGYFGFLTNTSTDEFKQTLVKRLSDWIKYIKEFESNSSDKKSINNPSDTQYEDYINMIIDNKNIKEIKFDDIKKDIFRECEELNGLITSNQIKRIIQKENKKLFQLEKKVIDTKEDYDLYAEKWGLPKSVEIKDIPNNNWVRLLRSDYSEFIKNFYTLDELAELCKEHKIDTIDKLYNFDDDKIPSEKYLKSGIYHINNDTSLTKILYVKQKHKKLF